MKACPYGYATLEELLARPDIDEWWGAGPFAAGRVRRGDLPADAAAGVERA